MSHFSGDSGDGALGRVAPPAIKVQNMLPANGPEAFLNITEWTAEAAEWPEIQWAAVLFPCLVGLAQKAMDTLPAGDVMGYKKVPVAILNMLNSSMDAYQRYLHETKFGPYYHLWLTGKHIQEPCMKLL